MKKKFIVILMTMLFVLCFALAACGNTDNGGGNTGGGTEAAITIDNLQGLAEKGCKLSLITSASEIQQIYMFEKNMTVKHWANGKQYQYGGVYFNGTDYYSLNGSGNEYQKTKITKEIYDGKLAEDDYESFAHATILLNKSFWKKFDENNFTLDENTASEWEDLIDDDATLTIADTKVTISGEAGYYVPTIVYEKIGIEKSEAHSEVVNAPVVDIMMMLNPEKTGYIVTGIGKLSETKNIEIPQSLNGKPVVEIADVAFDSKHNIETVTIPGSVKKIGIAAFASCVNLSSVVLSTGLEEIAEGAFSECRSLQSIILPDSLVSIGKYAFRASSFNSSIIIPLSVTDMGEGAFYDCYLQKIYCRAASMPSSWNDNWSNHCYAKIIYGYQGN